MVGYFPNETWYDYETGELVNSSDNSTIELAAPLDKIPVHCRGGYVIPFSILVEQQQLVEKTRSDS